MPNEGESLTSYLRRMEELMHRNRYARVASIVEEELPVEQSPAMPPEDEIKKVLKERHLTRDERLRLNKPKSDWFQTSLGEVCRNAVTLEVEDILSKHNVS